MCLRATKITRVVICRKINLAILSAESFEGQKLKKMLVVSRMLVHPQTRVWAAILSERRKVEVGFIALML